MNKSTAALVLSGGSGKRMAGVDKGLQTFRGRRLIEWVIEALSNQVEHLVISINRNQAEYRTFNFPLIVDDAPLYQGPVAGICAGLTHLQQHIAYQDCDTALISSCDTPYLPENFLAKLSTGLQDAREVVAVANDGHRRQNLHCLIRRDAWQSLMNFYAEGGRSMHKWLQQIDAIEVDFSYKPDAFVNINTLEQLAIKES